MDKKIRVGAVSYLNTKPLMYAFNHGYSIDGVEIVQDYPAKVADMLLKGEIDVGLVPVAILPQMPFYQIVGDYCIAAEQDVASVCLFSEVPLDRVQTILLDYQSKTSVALVKILVEHFWKLDVTFQHADVDYEKRIKGTTAGVIIGDRAFKERTIHKYYYDLAGEWIEFTRLPFVFAAWVSNSTLPQSFVEAFNNAIKLGLQHLDDVITENPSPYYDLKVYFTDNISYHWTKNKQKGLELFLKMLENSTL